MHSSSRIDRQLIGRAARQGDPGSFQFFLSLEDELFKCLPLGQMLRHRRNARQDSRGELPAYHRLTLFRRTQQYLELLHRKNRRDLLRQEKQRGVSPTLYCDVTDSWMLRDKWQRIWISAAGVLVEVMLSAIAIVV